MKIKFMFGVLILVNLLVSQTVLAQGSVQHSGQASKHGVNAIGHSMAGGGKLISGAVAVPLTAVGSVGKVAGDAGKEMWNNATAPIGEPLPVTEDTITAGPPPAKAIQVEGDQI